MLSKLGFQAGNALGAEHNLAARLEPIGLEMKDNRGGIGLDTEKKRRFREEADSEAKRFKAEEGDFRERVARERGVERTERQVSAAMRVAERMDEEENEKESTAEASGNGEGVAAHLAPTIVEKEGLVTDEAAALRRMKPSIKQVNILWRGLARDRAQKERDRRMRHDLMQSLSKNANYNDPEDDAQERQAFGREEADLEEDDPELDDFIALEPAERLRKLVEHLRGRYHYCFWCKYRYEDEEMDGCPGLTEEDHD